MENGELIIIVNNFFKKNPPPFYSFDYGELISNRKLKNARKLYAPYDPEKERPILVIDDTFFKSARRGMLLTNKNLYFRFRENFSKWHLTTQQIPLKQIFTLNIQISSNASILLINGKKVASILVFGNKGFMKTESEVLNELFILFLKSVHENED